VGHLRLLRRLDEAAPLLSVRARQVPQVYLAATCLIQQEPLVLTRGRLHEAAALVPISARKLCRTTSFQQHIVGHLLLP